ncbi:hypothetical protein RESH_03793 [Rhodopirellula europaea SH398]|uniref:Uncharacterized protein n=2 Tax=Rhodopirellula TaxID=265488 RepID=M5S201_9BACT|nr:hypothetical protein RESH_03793 [Rhodopirellula europaea SH398]KLU07608.1 hypothetical protein RISK_000686 [Rhodopirellula islandica]
MHLASADCNRSKTWTSQPMVENEQLVTLVVIRERMEQTWQNRNAN